MSTTSTMTDMVIHTDTPLAPLLIMIAHEAQVEIGKTPGGHADCIYGWLEPQNSRHCKPHHRVFGADDETIYWIARTLVVLGYQVVVTAPNAVGDDEVVDSMPILYDSHHAH